METYNNWLVSNAEKIKNGERYRIDINLFPFKKANFHDSADWVAHDIYSRYENIFVALSGGLDSDYVVRCFHRNKIPFTPIITKCAGSEKETGTAEKICHDLNIVPKIINATSIDIIKTYSKFCQAKINGSLSILQAIAAQHTFNKGGVLITGHVLLGDTSIPETDKINEGIYDLNDHDHVLSAIYDAPKHIGFFLYHPQIAYSMIENVEKDLTWNQYKAKLYGVAYRDKIRTKYSHEVAFALRHMAKKHNVNRCQSYLLGNTEQTLKIFEPFIIDQ